MMGPDELAALIDRHAAALVLYARQWTHAPEDAVQTAFVKLAAAGTRPPDPAAWLYRVVKNAALDATRADRRRRKHEAAAADRAAPWFDPPDDPAGLDAAAAAAALADLPGDEREAVVAHLWGGLTFAQIGAAVGASAATCHRRYTAGLARLRTLLGVPCPKTT